MHKYDKRHEAKCLAFLIISCTLTIVATAWVIAKAPRPSAAPQQQTTSAEDEKDRRSKHGGPGGFIMNRALGFPIGAGPF